MERKEICPEELSLQAKCRAREILPEAKGVRGQGRLRPLIVRRGLTRSAVVMVVKAEGSRHLGLLALRLQALATIENESQSAGLPCSHKIHRVKTQQDKTNYSQGLL